MHQTARFYQPESVASVPRSGDSGTPHPPQPLAPSANDPVPSGDGGEGGPTGTTAAPGWRPGIRIQTKLLLTLLGLGLVTLATITALTYTLSLQSFRQLRLEQLRALRNIFVNDINDFFHRTRVDVASDANGYPARSALSELSEGRRTLFEDLETAGFRVDNTFLATINKANREAYTTGLFRALATVRGEALDPAQAERFLPRDRAASVIQYVYGTENPLLKINGTSHFRSGKLDDLLANERLPQKFREAFARTSYAQSINRYDEFFRNLAERDRYDDVVLADADGNIVYTLVKGWDLGTNLRAGLGRETEAGHVFLGSWYAPEKVRDPAGRVVVADFAPYPFAMDAPAVFFGAPINDFSFVTGGANDPYYPALNTGRRAGAFLVRLGPDPVNDLFSNHGRPEEAGLGATGFAYMIGNDFVMRSEARNLAELGPDKTKPRLDAQGNRVGDTAVLKWVSKTPASQAIFTTKPDFDGAPAGKGELVYRNNLGYDVIGAYAPLSIDGLDAGIVLRVATSEAFAPVYRLRNALLVVGGGLLLFLAVAATLLARSFARPINGLADAAAIIATGNNTVRAPVESRDEVGRAAREFNAMVESRIAAQTKAETENRELQTDIRELLMIVSDAADGDMTVRARVTEGALGNVADAFNLMVENIGDLLSSVQAATARVQGAAGGIKGSADNLAAGAAAQADQITQTVGALQQMAENLQVVSLNADGANVAATDAASAAEAGHRAVREVVEGMERIRRSVQNGARKIKRLGERSMEISTILGTIQAISTQTDLLALNASIEAARAGEEGRGFTIVAEEVRKLSDRTGQAVKEIERLVAAMQTDTGEAVTGMETQVAEVERESTAVAGAGQELGRIRHAITESALLIGAINEASREQAVGAVSVVSYMGEVQFIADQAQAGSEETRRASAELDSLAGELTNAVGRFKV